MTDHLIKAKDYIYVVCTPLNTLLTIFGLLFVSYWWDERKKKDNQEREDRLRRGIDREEARQKETRETRKREMEREEARQRETREARKREMEREEARQKETTEAREKEREREEARQKETREAREKEMEREEARQKETRESREREREREEARQKVDAEKIAAVLSQEYDKVEKIFHNFMKNVEKLKAKNISCTFTEFDVLRYMCHLDNMEIFDNTDQQATSSDELSTRRNIATFRSSGYGIREVTSDINKIMKLFIEFRIQLSSIHDKACPEDMESEFSDEIIKMGKTVYLFVSTPRQKVIEKVLRYFGSEAEPPNAGTAVTESTFVPGAPNAGTELIELGTTTSVAIPQNADTESTKLLIRRSSVDAERFFVTGPSSANQGQASNHPGDNTIKRAIPYINYFRYKNGEMSCNIECKYSCFKNLESCVERRITGVMKKEIEIRDAIKKLWPEQPSEHQLPEGDLLHLIRMVMFKMLDNSRSNFFNEEHLKGFVEYVKPIVNSENLDTVIELCKRELGDIATQINNLCRGNFKPVLEDITTPDILHYHAEGLRMFVGEMVKKHNISIGTMTQDDMGTIERPCFLNNMIGTSLQHPYMVRGNRIRVPSANVEGKYHFSSSNISPV